MVERHLKFMKGLVRQLAHPEGSMMERYTVYQNMLYVSEYLPILVSSSVYIAFVIRTPTTNLKGSN